MACPSQQSCSADPQTSTRGQSFLAAAHSILPQDPQCSPDKPNLCAADELRTVGRKLEEKTKGERAAQWAHIRPPRTVSRDGLTNPRRCSMMLEKPGSRRGARTRGQRLSLRGAFRPRVFEAAVRRRRQGAKQPRLDVEDRPKSWAFHLSWRRLARRELTAAASPEQPSLFGVCLALFQYGFFTSRQRLPDISIPAASTTPMPTSIHKRVFGPGAVLRRHLMI